MAEPAPNSVEKLVEGILAGRVPRQVRLFAAQGLLPVSREELFRLQVILTADPDAELAQTASKALSDVPVETLIEWIEHQEVDPLELDLLARVRSDSEIWMAISNGKMDGQQAFMQGKYRAEGDFSLLMKLNDLFKTG